jgi:tetratricopeptide (TPR) repeat protein
MEPAMRGYLGEKLLADLIREVAHHKLSGLLRFSQDKTIKAIFFESGAPVFAISNLASEQIEYKLVKERLVTSGLVEAARQRNDQVQRLGQTLVEIGALAEHAMRQAARELVVQIIKSLFEWQQGEYIFDENVNADHAVKLNWTAADCILEGARHAAGIKSVAALIAPEQKLIGPADAARSLVGSTASLSSSEGYVLACIQYPTSFGEVSEITGLSEEESRRAVCVLLSLGALMLFDGGKERSPADVKPVERKAPVAAVAESDDNHARWVMDEITRKMEFFETADYYEMLGVDRLATTITIRQAYYDLEMMFNSFRERWPARHELNSKLDSLFAKINRAYYTLSDLSKRRSYDMPDDKRASFVPGTGHSNNHQSNPLNAGQPTAAQAISHTKPPVVINLKKAAAEKYNQGRARYEGRDFHAAAHLLREAVKLDNTRAEYHYYLASTLAILSQARHTHDNHEGCHVSCNLGGSLIRNQRVRYEAVQHFQEAARLEPSKAEIRVKLGLLYKEAGISKKAEACFWEALMLDGNNQIALQELGLEDHPEIAKQENPLSKKDMKNALKKKTS